MSKRIGLWLVGARGAVATTVQAGLAAVARGDQPTTGLVTELPPLCELPLVAWDRLVVGGHETAGRPLVEAAQALENQRVLPVGLTASIADQLAANDARIRPGVTGSGAPREEIDSIKADLIAFQQRSELDRVVVVLLASTEPEADVAALPRRWADMERAIADGSCPLPASSRYAVAAIDAGMPVVNFTPSLGVSCPAIEELAVERGVCHAGRDGKTGETLLKTVLAPMFAARNLDVMSWVGHNLLGNEDGRVLDDPANKAAKVRSKAGSLDTMLPHQAGGNEPQSHVSIEYIRSLGDWKTAWDHVHFRGFLGAPMTLQFTWQGCDSALAAPLVLDLARLVDHAAARGESGALTPLASFFKSPVGDAPHAFFDQLRVLHDDAARLIKKANA
ncbi:MAG: inositol-3-phosphate synthase [Planctomycetota bacterium]